MTAGAKKSREQDSSEKSGALRPRAPHPIRPDVDLSAHLPKPRYQKYSETLIQALVLTSSSLYHCLRFTVLTCARYLWNHPFHATFNSLVLTVLWLMIITGSEVHQEMILGKISDHTVDAIIDASRFSRNFESPEVTGGNTREYLNVGGPDWAQREGIRAVLFHARKAGLSIEHQAVLLATVEVESGFNPLAKAATTSACGLFQFVKATGKKYGLAQKDCMNPWLNAKAGVQHYIDNYQAKVAKEVAGKRDTEKLFIMFEKTYYMHHDGPHYSNPSNDVKAVVLLGTPFLLKVYHLLVDETKSKHRAPSFGEKFASNLWDILHQIRSIFGEGDTGPLSKAKSALPVPPV